MDEATAKKIVRERRTMRTVQKQCDKQGLPYPPELIRYLSPTPPSLIYALRDLPRCSCTTPHKVKYRSRKAAETSAEKQWLMDRRLVTAYPCGDHFHLTSQGCSNGH